MSRVWEKVLDNNLKDSVHNQHMLHFRSFFVVLAQFLHVSLNSIRKRSSNDLSIVLHFVCNKNLWLWVRFPPLSKTKCKAADKILEKHSLKEFKVTCKNAGDAELKQKKRSEMWHRSVMDWALQLLAYWFSDKSLDSYIQFPLPPPMKKLGCFLFKWLTDLAPSREFLCGVSLLLLFFSFPCPLPDDEPLPQSATSQ